MPALRLKPNSDRIEADLKALARIGQVGETGVSRLTWSEEDLRARKYVMTKMEDAGMEVREDAVGNIIGRRKSLDPSLPAVMTGSHIDTPDLGGNYDGMVGVIGGIEVVRMLNDNGVVTHHPLEVVVFAGEEIEPFGAGCKGSIGMTGLLTDKKLDEWRHRDGHTYREALQRAGFPVAQFETAVRDPDTVKAYVELHIEQGRVLEENGKTIGVVTSITGESRYKPTTIRGIADHAGGTPMSIRRDALCAACEIVLAIERFAREEAEHGTVGTVGSLKVYPGSSNVIPGKVEMSIELRGNNGPSKRRAMAKLDKFIEELRRRRPVEIEFGGFYRDEDPFQLTEEIVNHIERTAARHEIPHMRMPSGGGHDAQYMLRLTKVGMIFVPSVGGFSHCPEEFTRLEDIVYGIQVLGNVLTDLAEQRGSDEREKGPRIRA